MIKKIDIENVNSLDGVRGLFGKLGFRNVKVDGNLKIGISDDSDESILVILVDDKVGKYDKYLDGVRVKYLTLITENFDRFTFVRKEESKSGIIKFKRYSFRKDDIGRTVLKKLNGLKYGDVGSFGQVFDTSEVVKKFYTEYVSERKNLVDRIEGIDDERVKLRYAQVLMDRLIFLYFVQKKKLLDGNEKYLMDMFGVIGTRKDFHLAMKGEDIGDSYYDFLKGLFFDTLSVPKDKRNDKGIPYLNGGLFRKHEIERAYKIEIGDEVFGGILEFLDKWEWYADERDDLGDERGMSPDILGHIFEKTINAVSDTGRGQKEKGAYYTPEVITGYISENTIIPYILDRINTEFKTDFKEFTIDILTVEIAKFLFKVLEKLSVLDNACGSGAFLVAAMDVLIGIWSMVIYRLYDKNEVSMEDVLNADKEVKRLYELDKYDNFEDFQNDSEWRYWIKRKIVTNNLYGVDIEEGAIEIAKLRLWLAMVSDVKAGGYIEPLPNIEYNIRCGNSLIGFTDTKFDTLDNYVNMKDLNIGISGDGKATIENLIKTKENLVYEYKERKGGGAEIKANIDKILGRIQDVMDRRFLMYVNGKLKAKDAITLEDLKGLNPFHWVLEFPFIFDTPFSKRCGFDVVIGNPPWNILKPIEKEFFYQFDDRLSKYGVDKIKECEIIGKLLLDSNIKLKWNEYKGAFRIMSKYFRESGDYNFQYGILNGKKVGGDLNLYKLFLERFNHVCRDGGYGGIITPSGFYTDAGTKGLRGLYFDKMNVKYMFGFENKKKIFDNVDGRFKFIVMISRKKDNTKKFKGCFMKHDLDVLCDVKKQVNVDWDLVKKMSPTSHSVLEFKNRMDVDIVKKMYQFDTIGNNWNLKLFREIDMTLDSEIFGDGGYVLYEGKMIEQFCNDFDKPRYQVLGNDIINKFGKGYEDFREYRLAFRAVASSTNRRSLIATILPENVVVGNSLIISKIFKDGNRIIDEDDLFFLCGIFNSFAMDYLLRLKITTNLNMFFIYDLPISRLDKDDMNYKRIVENVKGLMCKSKGFEEFDVGDMRSKVEIMAENDVIIARLYGIDEDEMIYLLDTFNPKKRKAKEELDGLKSEILKKWGLTESDAFKAKVLNRN